MKDKDWTPVHLKNEKYCECIHWAWTPDMGNYDQDGHHPGCETRMMVSGILTDKQKEDKEQQLEYIRSWNKDHHRRRKEDQIRQGLAVVAVLLVVLSLIFLWGLWR